jgi:hypothetical protein
MSRRERGDSMAPEVREKRVRCYYRNLADDLQTQQVSFKSLTYMQALGGPLRIGATQVDCLVPLE